MLFLIDQITLILLTTGCKFAPSYYLLKQLRGHKLVNLLNFEIRNLRVDQYLPTYTCVNKPPHLSSHHQIVYILKKKQISSLINKNNLIKSVFLFGWYKNIHISPYQPIAFGMALMWDHSNCCYPSIGHRLKCNQSYNSLINCSC